MTIVYVYFVTKHKAEVNAHLLLHGYEMRIMENLGKANRGNIIRLRKII